MVDAKIGKRIKECRKKLRLTQEQLAEKTGFSSNYISAVERGVTFPRYENLIILLNALEVSADAIFCDVVHGSMHYREAELSRRLEGLPCKEREFILDFVEFMIKRQK